MTNITKLYSSLLDKSKELDRLLSPTLIKNLVIVGCGILLKETVNLNKIKNQVGCLAANTQTLPDSHYRRLTRFLAQPVAKRHLWKWLMGWAIGYIRRWDGRSMSLFLTAPAARPGWNDLGLWADANSTTGVELGLSGRELALVLG